MNKRDTRYGNSENNGSPGAPGQIFNSRHAQIRLSLPVHPQDDAPAAALLMDQANSLEDLQPQEGDLMPFTFRLLSAVYLGSGGYHLDFSRDGVLEKALPVFLEPEAEGSVRTRPLVVVRDHSFDIEDRLGLVRRAEWQPADPEHGLPYPGINAELHINWKLGADVVRRLLHDPPLLDACSVSLGFNWEKSHPGLDDRRFWMELGEEFEGSIIRLLVTDILSVEHVGLVFAGADPSARQTATAVQSIAAPVPPPIMTVSPSTAPSTGLRARLRANLDRTVTRGESMDQQKIFLDADSPLWNLFGMKDHDLQHLEERAREVVALADLGQDALADLRQEVQTLIVQLDGAGEGGGSLGLMKVIETADLATLRALKAEYARRLETMIPARCEACGSDQVLRRSSRQVSPGGDVQPAVDPGLYR
ncbi:MAG: hypothetical protein IIB42_08505 [Candidatus Marinimicrobia bacterium]|nr:hypothetical protein [Candidatus Neomarinimicrobiota bacterium]